jgi:hypothetical protein
VQPMQSGVDWDDERAVGAPTASAEVPDERALNLIAGEVNQPGECQGADFVEFVSQLLPRTGRAVVDSDVY